MDNQVRLRRIIDIVLEGLLCVLFAFVVVCGFTEALFRFISVGPRNYSTDVISQRIQSRLGARQIFEITPEEKLTFRILPNGLLQRGGQVSFKNSAGSVSTLYFTATGNTNTKGKLDEIFHAKLYFGGEAFSNAVSAGSSSN